MWLMTTDGFYSVIRWHDGRMCVRARQRVALDRLRKIGPALSKVQVTPGKDYRYRCFCTAEEWAEIAAELARRIDYGNFKSEVARKRGWKDPYEEALHKIWTVLGKIQPAGPYGYDTRKGYPVVPKNERKAVREAPRPVYGQKGFASSFEETPSEQWREFIARSPQLRLPALEEAARACCVECGNDSPGELEQAGRESYCRDVGACLARAEQEQLR